MPRPESAKGRMHGFTDFRTPFELGAGRMHIRCDRDSRCGNGVDYERRELPSSDAMRLWVGVAHYDMGGVALVARRVIRKFVASARFVFVGRRLWLVRLGTAVDELFGLEV